MRASPVLVGNGNYFVQYKKMDYMFSQFKILRLIIQDFLLTSTLKVIENCGGV